MNHSKRLRLLALAETVDALRSHAAIVSKDLDEDLEPYKSSLHNVEDLLESILSEIEDALTKGDVKR